MTMAQGVPFFRPDIGSEEIQEVVSALESGWLTTGPKVKTFEEEFARAVGAEHAIAVNSWRWGCGPVRPSSFPR
jgi:dTDP-4-amino-4,6-dideoxygalactose transaminase